MLLKVTSIVILKISFERDAFLDLRYSSLNCHQTYHLESFSWKVTIRESSFRKTSFRENDHLGKLLSGKRL